MVWRLIFIGIILFGLTGCASLDLTYDEEGRVTKVKSKGLQDTLVENKDGTKVHRKTAFKLWPKEFFTIYKD